MEKTGNAQSNGKFYLSISHEIKDYASWKPGFDENGSVRTEAGIKDVFTKQDVNNENAITAFFEVSDLDKANAFLSAPELKEAMVKAGVTSEPAIVFYTSDSSYDVIDTSAMLTTVSHSVKDFSTWKAVYDSSAGLRESAGTKDYHVLRSLSDENVVTVMGTASSKEKFNEFISNPDLKGAMEAAGVTSKPEVKVLQ
jgi:hypothetical protein